MPKVYIDIEHVSSYICILVSTNILIGASIRLSQERTSDPSVTKNITKQPSVGDQIGILTINNFFHIGTLEAFDDKNDAIYLKNGIFT